MVPLSYAYYTIKNSREEPLAIQINDPNGNNKVNEVDRTVIQKEPVVTADKQVTGPKEDETWARPTPPPVPSPQEQKAPTVSWDKWDGGSVTPSIPKPTPVEPKPTQSPTGPVTDGAPTTSTVQPKSPVPTVNDMLTNPKQFLTDQNLNQQYTALDVYQKDEQGNIVKDAQGNPVVDPEQTQDPTKFNLGQMEDLTAQTLKDREDAKAAENVSVQNFSAALINPDDLTKAVDEIAKLDPMKAASMSEHLDELLAGMEDGNVPLWARPAVAQVEQMLASRGISASSIGRDSLFNAIIQSAMPIAQQDASFEQEAYKTNYNAKVQAVLSDVNMEFASKQFNANSINQTNQFRAQLKSQVDLQNAARKDAMTQFNANMDFQGDQFNATQVNSMTQVSSQLQSQRQQFNAQMSSQIEQSNVNWRRQVNQANTAGVNAVNQANVQNAFNLSNQALTFLWQEMRDEAHWDFQATESEKDRKNQLEATLLASETAMGGEIGKTIENILNGSNFVSKFLDSWST